MESQTQDESAPKPRRRGRPRTRGVTTQMNVRVDCELKARGDEVLRAAGTNPTDIISKLWSYVARTESVPEFLTDEEIRKRDEELGRLYATVNDAQGMAWKILVREGVLDDRATLSLTDEESRPIVQFW